MWIELRPESWSSERQYTMQPLDYGGRKNSCSSVKNTFQGVWGDTASWETNGNVWICMRGFYFMSETQAKGFTYPAEGILFKNDLLNVFLELEKTTRLQ